MYPEWITLSSLKYVFLTLVSTRDVFTEKNSNSHRMRYNGYENFNHAGHTHSSIIHTPLMMWRNETYSHFRRRLLENYRPEDGPGELMTRPARVVVNITVHVSSFSGVSVEKMEVIVGMYLAQQWTDHRLEFYGPTHVSLTGEMTSKIWTPDTYFPNEKEGYRHSMTKTNAFARIYPNGTVYYNQRVKIVFSCLMMLYWFPVDTQICPMTLESYGHTAKDIKLHWFRRWEGDASGDMVTFESGAMQSPEFGQPTFYATDDLVNYGGTTDQFSSIKVFFVLRRRIGFYLLDAYMPFMCIVMVSWASCWLSVQAVPARASIGVVTVLSIVVHNEGIQRRMPHVSYMKALDLYMIVSLLFVVLALAEFCVAHLLQRGVSRSCMCGSASSSSNTHLILNNNFEECSTNMDTFRSHSVRRRSSSAKSTDRLAEKNRPKSTRKCAAPLSAAQWLDRQARMLFPATYVLFNIVYWSCLVVHNLKALESIPKHGTLKHS